MRLAKIALTVATCAAILGTTPAPVSALPDSFRITTVARLESPTGIAFTPSGATMFVNERSGRIRIVRDGKLLTRPFASVETTMASEGGLLGIAVHPDFERGERWVYVFHTTEDGSEDIVIRLRADRDRAGERDQIMRMPSGSGYHHGGILAFGPDGKLYISNGESHEQRRAQDPDVLGGKIYRLNADGSIPDDNPFRGEPTWSYGHRNPFGLAFDPATGNLWSSENGPDANDELNLIERGGNYGWPVVKGRAGRARYKDPARDYERIIVPTMMAFAGDAFPARYRGDLFLGSYGERALRRLTLNGARTRVAGEEIFTRFEGGVVGVAWGPDGLYVTTVRSTGGTLHRIAPRRAATTPTPTPVATDSPTPAPSASPTRPPSSDAGRSPLWPLVAVAALVALGGAATLVIRARRST